MTRRRIAIATAVAALWGAPADAVPLRPPPEKPKAWIGIGLAKPEPAVAAPGAGPARGDDCVLVTQVFAGSAGFTAGMETGDRVCAVDGTSVKTPEDLIALIRKRDVGAQVTLLIVRGKAELTKKLALSPRPEDGESYLKDVLLGKPAPPLTIDKWYAPPPSGAAITLAGKVTLIDFWAPWCMPCLATIPWLNEMHQRFGAKGLQVIGVTTEPESDVAAVKTRSAIAYPLANDVGGKLSAQYMVMAIPTMVLIDAKGVLREASVGGGGQAIMEKAIVEMLGSR